MVSLNLRANISIVAPRLCALQRTVWARINDRVIAHTTIPQRPLVDSWGEPAACGDAPAHIALLSHCSVKGMRGDTRCAAHANTVNSTCHVDMGMEMDIAHC